jgi:hypothetical protein
MNQILEYIHKNPKETKRLIGIDYEPLIKLIEKAKEIEEEKNRKKSLMRNKDFKEIKLFKEPKEQGHRKRNQEIKE